MPDRTFADKLRPLLLEKLAIAFPAADTCLVDAVDALADIGDVVEEEDGTSSDDDAEFFDAEEERGNLFPLFSLWQQPWQRRIVYALDLCGLQLW